MASQQKRVRAPDRVQRSGWYSIHVRALAVAAPLLAGAAWVAAIKAPDRDGAMDVAATSRRAVPTAVDAVVATSAPLDSDTSPDQAAITWSHRIRDYSELCDDISCPFGDGPLRFGDVRVPRDVAETIVSAARETGVDPSLMMAIAEKESSFVTHSSASTSSAKGLFQFIDRTWLRAVRAFGAKYGLAGEAAEIIGPDENPHVDDAAERERILALRDDPRLASLLAGELLTRDSAELERDLGRPLTAGEAYLIHFLGPRDAAAFITRVEKDPRAAAARLLPRPARANRSIFFAGRRSRPLSFAAVHAEFEKMMASRIERYASVSVNEDTVAR